MRGYIIKTLISNLGLFLIGCFLSEAGAQESVLIGPDGGTVSLQGTINHVELEIPPGALSSYTVITIRQVFDPAPDQFFKNPTIPVGNTFSFEPHNLIFSNLAIIRFSYTDDVRHRLGSSAGSFTFFVNGPDGLFHYEVGPMCSSEVNQPDCVPKGGTDRNFNMNTNIATLYINNLKSYRLLGVEILKPIIGACGGGLLEDLNLLENGTCR